jgi:hypothetical protein
LGGGDVGELLIWLLESIPWFRRRLERLRTHTRIAPPPSTGADSVMYGVWHEVVIVTISFRDKEGAGTELTIAGHGSLPRKVAAVVSDLRHSIEIQSGSLNPSR